MLVDANYGPPAGRGHAGIQNYARLMEESGGGVEERGPRVLLAGPLDRGPTGGGRELGGDDVSASQRYGQAEDSEFVLVLAEGDDLA